MKAYLIPAVILLAMLALRSVLLAAGLSPLAASVLPPLVALVIALTYLRQGKRA